jgi:hypothetical protein
MDVPCIEFPESLSRLGAMRVSADMNADIRIVLSLGLKKQQNKNGRRANSRGRASLYL